MCTIWQLHVTEGHWRPKSAFDVSWNIMVVDVVVAVNICLMLACCKLCSGHGCLMSSDNIELSSCI